MTTTPNSEDARDRHDHSRTDPASGQGTGLVTHLRPCFGGGLVYSDGVHAIAHLTGELDLASAAAARELLHAIVDLELATVDVDLSRLAFIDAAGLAVLAGAAQRARRRGSRLWVSGARRNVARTLRLTGLDHALAAPTTAAPPALAAP